MVEYDSKCAPECARRVVPGSAPNGMGITVGLCADDVDFAKAENVSKKAEDEDEDDWESTRTSEARYAMRATILVDILACKTMNKLRKGEEKGIYLEYSRIDLRGVEARCIFSNKYIVA